MNKYTYNPEYELRNYNIIMRQIKYYFLIQQIMYHYSPDACLKDLEQSGQRKTDFSFSDEPIPGFCEF